MKKDNLHTRKFEYKWVIVGLSMLMIFVCLGFCSSTKGLFVSAITEALGIKRSLFSINDSCRFIATAIVNVFFGSMVAKFGTRKLIGAGFIFLSLSAFIYSIADNIYMFYLGGALLGIGFSWTGTTMVGCVVNKWCKENKGTIMGAVLAVNGIGGAVATQIISPIIYQEGTLFGYRDAYRLIALIVLITGIIVVGFFKESPKGFLQTHHEVSKKKGRGQSWVGIEYSELIRKPYFYTSLVFIFLTGMCLQGVSGVSAAHMKDTGLSAEFVATVVSMHSLALTAFKLIVGMMYDRFGLKVTSNVCSVTASVVMVLLALVSPSPVGKAFAVVYGIFSSLALPLETIMLPIYVSDLFGEKSFDKVLGLFVSVNVAGYAVGSPLTNFCFDVFGSYKPILFVAGGMMIVVTFGIRVVIKMAQKERALIEEKQTATV